MNGARFFLYGVSGPALFIVAFATAALAARGLAVWLGLGWYWQYLAVLVIWSAANWAGVQILNFVGQRIGLARYRFNGSRKPRVVVSGFHMMSDPDLRPGERIDFVFLARNVGDGPVRVVEVRSANLVLRSEEKIPDDLDFPFKQKFNLTLASQERELIPGNNGIPLGASDPMEIFAGNKVLLCMGAVAFLDARGRRRETGFCRRYRPRERAWDIIREYEYAI